MTVALPDRDLLARLVAFPSVSGGNDAAIVDFVCDYLDQPGLRVERIPSLDGTRCNILVTTGNIGASRHGLVLCGHLDVVPADEPEWTSDPFALVERDGRLFGRGACDMKAFVAIAMNALVAASTRALRHPLVGVFTFDEELGSLGAQDFARATKDRPPLPTDCIIGEPTSLRPVRMHKGHLKLRITITGKPAHSGSPHLGINAIEPAGEIVTKLAGLAREYEQAEWFLPGGAALNVGSNAPFPPPSEGGGKGVGGAPDDNLGATNENTPHPPPSHLPQGRGGASDAQLARKYFQNVPYPVLCIASIRGGEAINVIPEKCEIDLGVRLLPGMKSEVAIERVRDIVRSAKHAAKAEVMVVNDNPPMLLTPPPSEGGGRGVGGTPTAIAPNILCELRALTNCPDDIGVSFASDAGVLQRDLGMRCVLFGPGSIEVAHRPDEFVPIAEFERCSEITTKMVHKWCEE